MSYASEWREAPWRREDPAVAREVRTWCPDPCPECGAQITGISATAETVRSNPYSLIRIPDPYCPHETDPDADCTCTVIHNPYPDPLYDELHPAGRMILRALPCGHRIPKITIMRQERAEPGTLGALYEEWGKADG